MAHFWQHLRKWSRTRVALLIAALLVLLVLLTGRPIGHLVRVFVADVDEREPIPLGHVDDASRLNQSPVAEVWPIPNDEAAAEEGLRHLLARARAEGRQVSIAGARHSMGGHTISRDGIVIDMLPFRRMKLDDAANILHVQAGAKWSEVIPYLDRFGRSVAVMQSNNSFSVGGSVSVNCHGWQFDRPPIASTVESLRLMKADGEIVCCSRTENAELFSLVLGGYGLFGIILDVQLRVVLNERYRVEQFIVPAIEALDTFEDKVPGRDDVRMVYARMNVASDRLLDDVILGVFSLAPDGPMPELTAPDLATLQRLIFRGSAINEYGKELRWEAETKLQPQLAGRAFSRNQLLNEGIEVFQNRSAQTTDILHEYFVPREGVDGFVVEMRAILHRHRANLLNVTVREVNEDRDTFLRYADRDVFSFVMLFLQDRSPVGEEQMAALTRDLIDSALKHGGRYYLPYRLHATPEQFVRAYPQAPAFFYLKRHYDPDGLFQNEFSRRYGQCE